MLTLIDRVTRFPAQRAGVPPNPAVRELLQRPEYRYANAGERDPLPEYYSEAQAKGYDAGMKALGIKQHLAVDVISGYLAG
jgi:hypothetical protein